MSTHSKINSKDSRYIKFVLVICSVVISCIIIEAFIRVSGLWVNFEPHQRNYYSPSTVDGIPYTLRLDMDSKFPPGRIMSNHDGYRTTITEHKKTNTIRILCLGDSITFGFGVDQSHAYPQQLEVQLNKSTSNSKITYEVINAGVDGYNAENEYYVLKNLIAKYSPDLIVWLLVSNDWDDSLQANNKGQLIFSDKSYSVSGEFLRLAWGWTKDRFDPDNYYLMMDKKRSAWADAKPIAQESFIDFKKMDMFLIKNYYSYPFIRSLFPPKKELKHFSDNELIYRNKPVVINGIDDFFPEIQSVTLSPFYNRRFYSAINKGVSLANSRNIPILISGLNIPIDTHLIHGKYIYEDISQYFSMPFMSFRQRYNLRWDGHLNSKGNKILATAFQQSLCDNKLLNNQILSKRKIYNTTLYWKLFRQYQKDYIENHIKDFIDFTEFKGVHQLLGGLYPPRTFPIKNGAELAVILKNTQADKLYISGYNKSNSIVEIDTQVGIDEFKSTFSVPPGLFLEIVDLTQVSENNYVERIVDIRLNCQSDNDVIRMDYIGFKKPKTSLGS